MSKNLLLCAIVILLMASCKKNSNKKSQDSPTNKTEQVASKKEDTKNAEIVFCLDATGSMSGLIRTAKEKIWDIVTDLSQDQDIDTLKLGMIFYRDRGDSFVTRQIPLTTNLDAVYTDLLEIEAAGGGDSPESVNQALNEAVELMQWTSEKNTYKTIFVVGDCPPHMDYQDDVKYTESCKIAAHKGITINTIKLGRSCEEAITHFKKMSECTNGKFLKFDQNATDYTIETPYDDEINKISRNIDESKLFYGDVEERNYKQGLNSSSLKLYEKASKASNSARTKYKLSREDKKTKYETKEIVDDYSKGKINLSEIDEKELPESLQKKTAAERIKILEGLKSQRDTSYAKLKELVKKRDQYIRAEKKKKRDTTSFSKQVIEIMRSQSKKKN